MKPKLLLLCLLFTARPVFADIVLSTSINYSYNLVRKDAQVLPELGKKDILSATTDLSALRIAHVRRWVYRYMTQYSGAVTRASHNARYYRTFVEDIFSTYPDFPQILSDLPILESSYHPKAVSHAGAAGLWQFMPQTARGLQMSINRWSDERYNLITSTESAIAHLSYLYNRHHSWELALAAYNCGSGRVDRAVQKYPDATYWELIDRGALPRETQTYVQKFAALAIINRNRELFGFPETTHTSYNTRRVTLKYPVAISDLSHYSGVPESVLYFLNPQLKRKSTPLILKDYSILIPADSVATFTKNEEKLYTLRFNCIKQHTVQKGEYLGKIAKKYNVPMRYIISINILKKPYTLYPGATLYIPVM